MRASNGTHRAFLVLGRASIRQVNAFNGLIYEALVVSDFRDDIGSARQLAVARVLGSWLRDRQFRDLCILHYDPDAQSDDDYNHYPFRCSFHAQTLYGGDRAHKHYLEGGLDARPHG